MSDEEVLDVEDGDLKDEAFAGKEEYERDQGASSDEDDEEPDEDDDDNDDVEEDRVPVTVITGFLGAGKTTLVNHILKDPNHGLKFAILENEFGDVGVDDAIIKQHSEDQIIEMLNGCVCCTVRKDIASTVQKLLERRDKFDAIIVETTGMADPSPVAQTFIVDKSINRDVYLDGILTVVDCKHVLQQLKRKREEAQEGEVNESIQQIAFADRIILNKTDLVSAAELNEVKEAIKEINSSAQTIESVRSVVDPKLLFGMKSFDVERIVEFEPEFLNTKEDEKDESHGHGHSHGDGHEGCGEHCKEEGHNHGHGHGHDHGHDHGHADHECKDSGCSDPSHSHGKKKKHNHNQGVSSLAFRFEEAVALPRLSNWLMELVEGNGPSLYRYKGVINVAGQDEQYVFQGVHQLFEGCFMQPWAENQKRVSKFVFIGKDLDYEMLEKGFNSCLAYDLRFKVGDKVECSLGEDDGFIPCVVTKTWNDGYPYRVRPDDDELDEMWVPEDDDEFIRPNAQPASKRQRNK